MRLYVIRVDGREVYAASDSQRYANELRKYALVANVTFDSVGFPRRWRTF